MSADLKFDGNDTARLLKVGCEISGFILDLEPSFIDYTFALVNVYRRGKERLSRLSAVYEVETNQQTLSRRPTASQNLPDTGTNILLSLHFLSGTINMRPTLPLEHNQGSAEGLSAEEVIKLPSLSVWAEFKPSPIASKYMTGPGAEPAVLLLKAFIHSSHNMLRPTILRFFTQITQGVEHQLVSFKQSDLNAPLPISKGQPKRNGIANSFMDGMQLTFNVQIDRSQLELTCQPDVNVLAGIQWDNGGFLVTISQTPRLLSLTGTIEGLRANLKHGYLREKCAEIDARNLSFNLTLDRVNAGSTALVNCASIVVDTELSASFRFSRLQDILCFRAVWLDHIPVFTHPLEDTVKEHPLTPRDTPTSHQFASVLLFRARQLGLFVDMGSNVASVNLDLQTLTVRTRLSESQSDIELSIAKVTTEFRHGLAGYASTPNFRFRTVRQRHGLPAIDADGGTARTLLMTLISGTLDIDLSLEGRRILYYQ